MIDDWKIVMKFFISKIHIRLILLVLLMSWTTYLKAQVWELDIMSSLVEGEREYYKKVDYSFEIKDQVLTIYDNSSGKTIIWRSYKLLTTNEDSDDVKSYDTQYATIRIYFPEKVENGYKGNLELNIVGHEYRLNWWKFSKKYPK